MAKASQLEVTARVEIIKPLLTDGLSLREIRAYVQASSDWGANVSDAQLKRYCSRARAEIAAEAQFDPSYEFAKAMRRNERALSRAATQGDLRTYLAANKAQCQLLQLSPAAEQSSLDVAAARHQLEEELAWALCEAEPSDEGGKS